MKPSPLNNTLYKIQKDKALTVGFFGGSVTVGIGASNQEGSSWRALTRDWLKSTFRKATITEVNASVGNAGSVFGVYFLLSGISGVQPSVSVSN